MKGEMTGQWKQLSVVPRAQMLNSGNYYSSNSPPKATCTHPHREAIHGNNRPPKTKSRADSHLFE